jgi:type I restriction enzyme S subunit
MKRVPLSQLAVISAGQSAPKDHDFSDSGMPFVRAGSLDGLLSGKSETDLELVSAETAKRLKLKTYPKGTILFAKSGMSATKDRIYVLQNPAHVVSHLATLIPREGTHSDYLRLALKRFPPSALIKDPAYPAISLGEIEGFEIPVPEDYADQVRIAHLLGKVESLIAQRKQHLQQLDDLLKSVFLEMFGDLQISEGESTLGDCLKIQQGFAFKSEEFVDAGTPVIKIGTVNKGFFDYSTLSFIADNYSEKFKRFEIRPGDLLISLTGTVGKDYYGKTCYEKANSVYPKYLLNQRVGKLICMQDAADPKFIDAFLKLPEVKAALIKQNRGVRQANLSNSDIYNIQLSIPALSQQHQFADIVEKAEGIKSRYQKSLANLEILYGALSHLTF